NQFGQVIIVFNQQYVRHHVGCMPFHDPFLVWETPHSANDRDEAVFLSTRSASHKVRFPQGQKVLWWWNEG
ncbi:hypothetical protein, partial [Vibrio parahaemolyticus]|uniref:hypothetical protein n=1 Tax=Vibrio parahaemolyticus TaxID=670 RepID=UPI0021116CBA